MAETALFEVSGRMRGPIRRALESYRSQAGLGTLRKLRRSFLSLVQITTLQSASTCHEADSRATFTTPAHLRMNRSAACRIPRGIAWMAGPSSTYR